MSSPTFLQSASGLSQLPEDHIPEIAFFGRSNVGKSSLINSILGANKLARTSNTPGRTRLINIFDSGDGFRLIDLPGYGYAKGSKRDVEEFQTLILDYLDGRKNLQLAIIVIDARVGITVRDAAMIQSAEGRGVPYVLIANKIDKLSRTQAMVAIQQIDRDQPNAHIIAHSAETKEGRTEIRTAIMRTLHR